MAKKQGIGRAAGKTGNGPIARVTGKHSHTAKMKGDALAHIRSISKKDPAAHSSHHDNHGEGDQKGMHGFGHNFTPGECYESESCEGGMGDNCDHED